MRNSSRRLRTTVVEVKDDGDVGSGRKGGQEEKVLYLLVRDRLCARGSMFVRVSVRVCALFSSMCERRAGVCAGVH